MLSTIGYEAASLEDFVATLLAAKVSVVVDIRERAQSRRKGFSKTALSERLKASGIGYVHFRQLGDPKPGREAARAGNMPLFRKIYRSVLRTEQAQLALKAIEQIQQKNSACLLCYEKDFEDCHRKLVADKLQKRTGRATKHLKVSPREQVSKQTGRVRYSRQSAATPQQQLL